MRQTSASAQQESAADGLFPIPPFEKLQQMADLYKLFSDPTRIRILWALNAGELRVGDIAHSLEMSASAVSHHLKSLRVANLVRFRRAGKNIYYALADNHVKDILNQGFGHVNE